MSLDLLAGLLNFIFVTVVLVSVTLLRLFGCGELVLRRMVDSFTSVLDVLSSSCTTRSASCWLFAMRTFATQELGWRFSCRGLLAHPRLSC